MGSVAADSDSPKRSFTSVLSSTVSSQSQDAWNPWSATAQHSLNTCGVGVRRFGGSADASRAVFSRSVTCRRGVGGGESHVVSGVSTECR